MSTESTHIPDPQTGGFVEGKADIPNSDDSNTSVLGVQGSVDSVNGIATIPRFGGENGIPASGERKRLHEACADADGERHIDGQPIDEVMSRDELTKRMKTMSAKDYYSDAADLCADCSKLSNEPVKNIDRIMAKLSKIEFPNAEVDDPLQTAIHSATAFKSFLLSRDMPPQIQKNSEMQRNSAIQIMPELDARQKVGDLYAHIPESVREVVFNGNLDDAFSTWTAIQQEKGNSGKSGILEKAELDAKKQVLKDSSFFIPESVIELVFSGNLGVALSQWEAIQVQDKSNAFPVPNERMLTFFQTRFSEAKHSSMKNDLKDLKHAFEIEEKDLKIKEKDLKHAFEIGEKDLKHAFEIEMRSKIFKLALWSKDVASQTAKINEQLYVFKKMSQASNTIVETDIARENSKRLKEEQAKMKEAAGDFENLPTNAQCDVDTLTKNVENLEDYSLEALREFWEVVMDEEAKNSICLMFNELNNFIQSSTIQNTQKTKASTQEQERGDTNQVLKQSIAELQRRLGGEERREGNLEFPTARGGEVRGVQPAMEVIITCLAKVGQGMKIRSEQENQPLNSQPREEKQLVFSQPSDLSTPPKGSSKREKAVIQNVGTKDSPIWQKRIADIILSKASHILRYFPPDAVPFVLELKSFYRSDKKWSDLATNAWQQILNHMAQYVTTGFNFSGCGIDCHATGLSGTLAYVRVHRLKLVNAGTAAATLKLENSCFLPLMNRATFLFWINQEKRDGEEEKYQDAVTVLYPGEESLPWGLIALLKYMCSSRLTQFGKPDVQFATPDVHSNRNLQLLSSGSFGDVFWDARNQGGGVFKVSRFGRDKLLKDEFSAYEKLDLAITENSKPSPNYNFEQVEETRLDIKLGKKIVKIYALRFKTECNAPGISLDRYMAKNKHEIIYILSEIENALCYMHEKGMYHNDVTPRNIVIKRLPMKDTGSDMRVVLIDLSLASTKDDSSFSYFMGTELFACESAQRASTRTNFKPDCFSDFASLGFVGAFICAKNQCPWKGSGDNIELKKSGSWFDYRRKAASNAIKGAQLVDKGEVAKYLSWVQFDDRETTAYARRNRVKTVIL